MTEVLVDLMKRVSAAIFSVLAAILLCFNFLGDGLRDLVDPRKAR